MKGNIQSGYDTSARRRPGADRGSAADPAQRRIAQCLVTHATKSAYLSSGDLATLAQVSQPSVTRFAMALGYDGYPALRDHLRITIDASWHLDRADRSAGNQYQQALNAEIDNLRQLVTDVADDAVPVAEAGRCSRAASPARAGVAGGRGPRRRVHLLRRQGPPRRPAPARGGSVLSDRLEQAREAAQGPCLRLCYRDTRARQSMRCVRRAPPGCRS